MKKKGTVQTTTHKIDKRHAGFRVSDDFYQNLIESLEDYAVFTTDSKGLISSWNTGAHQLLGYKEKEILGKDVATLFVSEDRKKNIPLKELKTAKEKGKSVDERWHAKKDGTRFWASGMVFPLKDEEGKLIGFTKVMRDLSAHKQIEVERTRINNIFENSPAFICTLHGKNHVFELANKPYYQLIGFRDVIGKPVGKALPEIVKQGFVKLLDTVYTSGKPFIGNEVPVRLQVKKNGPLELHYLNFVYQPIREVTGEISGIFVHGVDVTEQVVTRQKVEQSQNNFAFLAEASKVLSASLNYEEILKNIAKLSIPYLADFCIFDIINEDNTIHRVTWEHVNKSLSAYVKRVETLTPDLNYVTNPVAHALKTGKSSYIPDFDDAWAKKAATSLKHLQFIKKLGYTSCISVPLRVRNKVSGTLTFIDTKESNRHYTQVDLHLAEEIASRASLAIENSQLYAAAQKDIEERKQMEENLRVSEERFRLAITAGKIAVWDWDIQKNTILWSDRVYELYDTTPQKFPVTYENFSKYLHPDDAQLAQEAITKAVDGTKPYNITYRIITLKGVIKWISSRAIVTRDGTGKPIRMLGATMDVTEERKVEQDKNDFVSIATHELKTPVTSLKAYAEVLQRKFAKSGDTLSATQLGKMNAQLDKLTSLISDLLDATKIEAGQLHMQEDSFDFDELVHEVTEELQRTTEKHTLLIKGSAKKKIVADRERTGQVLTNLIANAIKYSPHTEKIIIKPTSTAKSVTLCVQDYGVGIPKGKQKKLFERFYRVSGPKENTFPGLGLGLYISSEIVKRQGGKIWVESTVGRGSIFCFSLPLKTQMIQQPSNDEELIKHE